MLLTIPVAGFGGALVWLGQYWSTLAMVGLALFSLVMLRSMVRAAPTGPGQPEAPGIVPMETNEADAAGAAAAARALVRHTKLSAVEIVQSSLEIAARICIYTNDHIVVEEVK